MMMMVFEKRFLISEHAFLQYNLVFIHHVTTYLIYLQLAYSDYYYIL